MARRRAKSNGRAKRVAWTAADVRAFEDAFEEKDSGGENLKSHEAHRRRTPPEGTGVGY